MFERVIAFVASCVVGWSAATVVAAQSQARADAPDRQAYSTATTAILVDVVVRDHRNHPVTDLSADDFSVFEDSTRQKVDTFTRVTRGGGIGLDVRFKAPGTTQVVTLPGAESPEAPSKNDPADSGATALVFDHLSDEPLRLSQRATLDYIPMNGDSGVEVAVFSTEPQLRLLQPYTKDRARLRHAVDAVLPAGSQSAELTAERRQQVMDRRRELQTETDALSAATVTGGGAALAQNGALQGQREAELQLLALERNVIDSFDALDRDHRGYDTSLAIVSIVRTLAERPGRKSIVFFSEGLPASPVLAAKFDDLISAANRANVTVYAVDARGLRTSSSSEETGRQVQELSENRLRQVASGSSRTERPLNRDFEKVEDLVRLDSRTGLARLATETGGFLIENSNDLSSAYKRIDEDNRFHYLLSYTPINTDFDGKFRTIAVKVTRPGVKVFSRKGYRAIRAGKMDDLNTYEAPAVQLLDRVPLPNAFEVRAAGFTFPDPTKPGVSPIVVHFTTDALAFNVDGAKSTYNAQAIVVVRIRDSAGKIVAKLSQQYVLSGDAKQVDAARHGDILFYREPGLEPGVYTLESIVFDALRADGSARLSTLTVPPADPTALGMSSLVLVSHSEEVTENPRNDGSAPLFVGHTLLYPNVGEPIAKSATNELPFFFTLYGDLQGVQAAAELLKDGTVIAQRSLTLPSGGGGRTQHVGRLPIEGLPAGIYELRIRVTGRGREVARTAFFTLQQ